MSDYEDAVKLLQSPSTWCQGAQMLADLGDPGSLIPLLQAYESIHEASRLCLLEAMSKLEPLASAHNLFDAEGAENRRLLVHLMELFPDPSHVSRLEEAARSEAPDLERQAARSLVCQPQTEAWEEAMTGLLEHEDTVLRGWIIEGLGLSDSDSARAALRDHLSHENSPELRAMIEQALSRMP